MVMPRTPEEFEAYLRQRKMEAQRRVHVMAARITRLHGHQIRVQLAPNLSLTGEAVVNRTAFGPQVQVRALSGALIDVPHDAKMQVLS